MDETLHQTYIHKAETELRENILPFWIAHTVDKERGGFYGELSNTLDVDKDAPRGALLSARILWTYSAAYKRYRAPEYLAMAQWTYDDLLTRFWDATHGGLYWMVGANGELLRPRKQIYGQAFGIYAFAEYYSATGEPGALDKAIALFRLMEEHSHDPQYGGYFEAYTRDWQLETDLRLSAVDMNEKKSMNTHLHVMEGYTNLLRVWDDDALRARQTENVDIMMHRIISPATFHTLLFFDEAWNSRTDRISYGHDIETNWLLVESAEVLGDERRVEEAKTIAVKMAQAVYNEGLDAEGGLVNDGDPRGVTDPDFEWWPQAEAAVGFLNAYQLSGQTHFLQAALRSWDFIERYFIDRQHGEWFRHVTKDHVVDRAAAKVSFWKCPYHNGRACMELIDRLGKMVVG
ncbi:MAG TPA: AGE family epimerase/isomerase [Anaerolineae bacterium]|nr:AGE family epimerase/isomerase [Anaerolineae bacterium]HQI83627.1 AGE family epimerase/isomerase [Anaerolineae bacterium]